MNSPATNVLKSAAILCLLTGWIEFCLAAEATDRNIRVVREYVEAEQRANFPELLTEYGQNKQLPEGYELQALLALSHYPALKEVKIQFVLGDVGIPISSRPYLASMLNSARNRTYKVIIDTEREGGRGALLLKNQPFNAQVGIIGHELAHTVYYLDRSFFGIAADAICQLNNCRIQFERKTDRRLVDYGLGWQRFDHASFVRGSFSSNSSQLSTAEGGGGAYMSPAELLSIIHNHPAYSD